MQKILGVIGFLLLTLCGSKIAVAFQSVSAQKTPDSEQNKAQAPSSNSSIPEPSNDDVLGGGMLDLFDRMPMSSRQLFRLDPEDGSVHIIYLGGVDFVVDGTEIFADYMGLVIDPKTVQSLTKSSDQGDSRRPFRIFAAGNILILRGKQSFRGESLFYDGSSKVAKITAARLRIDLDSMDQQRGLLNSDSWNQRRSKVQGEMADLPPANRAKKTGKLGLVRGGRLVIAAKELRLHNFDNFVGQDVVITTCDFEHPHWGLAADKFEARKVGEVKSEGAGVAGKPKGAGEGYQLSLSGVGFQVHEKTLLPLPSLSWDTTWTESLPIRSAALSSSSKYGNRARIVWNGNLLLPKSTRSWADLGVVTDYMGKRGMGYGADLELGEKPYAWGERLKNNVDYYLTGTFFGVKDRGMDRNRRVPETEDRNRARVHSRLRLPTGTLVDIEYAVERDRNFLNEYFQREFQSQKSRENLVYVRHAFSPELAVTGLAKKRLVNYRTVVERLPEVALHWVEKPFLDGLFNIDAAGRAGQLNFEPVDTSLAESRRMGRADLLTRLSMTLGSSRYGKIRPFVELRGTAWQQDFVDDSAIERLSMAAGARIGWHLGRTFKIGPSWLLVDMLRHQIQPALTFRTVFENNVQPMDLYRYDSTEDVQKFEVLTLSLRQAVYGRNSKIPIQGEQAPGQSKILELNLANDYFPDSGRDNQRQLWGELRGELIAYPVPKLAASTFIKSEYDWDNGGQFSSFDVGLRWGTFDQPMTVDLSKRWTRHLGDSIVGRIKLSPSEKYSFHAFLERDFRRNEFVNQEYAVIRHFHRWSMLMALELDEGEGDNVAFTVKFAPRDLISFEERLDPAERARRRLR